MQTEKQKMLAGELYCSSDPELVQERTRANHLNRLYNLTTKEEAEQRIWILRELLGQIGSSAWIKPPFYCDYGQHIFVGDDVFFNFGCVLLDCNTVHIGNHVLFGPSVQIYTAYHPTDPEERLTGLEYAAPVHIGNNVWVGGGAIICPGVTIGANTTIGAGSVVVHDIPDRVVAVGNPCRVIQNLA